MDITNLNVRKAANEGAELQLKHPVTFDDLPDGIIIVAGSDSDVFKVEKYIIAARRMKYPNVPLDMAELESDARQMLSACIISWGKVTINGETPLDNEQTLIDYPWIREQIDAFIGKRANFIKSA